MADHPRRLRWLAMRPRRPLVRTHRWVAIGLLAWLVVVAVSGGWLAVSHSTESWLHSGRYRATDGDIGPDAALAAGEDALPEDATTYGLTRPRNGRGVYQVYGEQPREGAPEDAEPRYLTVFVDPGSGRVNSVVDDEAGFTHWLYRGHLYLWQDHGIAGVFDSEHGWCRPDSDGHEPGGAKGVVCDVLPDGQDLVGWLGVGWVVVLVSGFYVWYWPGVKRWANALRVTRGRGPFAFNMSLHKVVGIVVWVPLMAVALTGIAFSFPNIGKWYDNVTPAERDFFLWTPEEEPVSGAAEGREPIGLDAALHTLQDRYPDRAVNYIGTPFDETGTYSAWVTRGFDPWTREGGAGNTYVLLDQYSGRTLYGGPPGDGNVFDQAWDDWQYPLHTGDFLGTPTRVAWVALAVSPLVLGVTGVVMNRIRARKRARRRPSGGDGGTVVELDAPVDVAQPTMAGS